MKHDVINRVLHIIGERQMRWILIAVENLSEFRTIGDARFLPSSVDSFQKVADLPNPLGLRNVFHVELQLKGGI